MMLPTRNGVGVNRFRLRLNIAFAMCPSTPPCTTEQKSDANIEWSVMDTGVIDVARH